MNENKYQICTKTICNKNGVLGYYHNFKKNIEPNWLKDDLWHKKLLQIVNKIKKQGKGKDFDCIIDCNYVDKGLLAETFYNPLSSSNFVSHNFSL
jgi:hypothetical protein